MGGNTCVGRLWKVGGDRCLPVHRKAKNYLRHKGCYLRQRPGGLDSSAGTCGAWTRAGKGALRLHPRALSFVRKATGSLRSCFYHLLMGGA